MSRLLTDRQILVWVVLVTATLVTAVLGLEQAVGAATVVGVVLLAIAFLKVRLIGIHFMELGTAPTALRLAFDGYVVMVFIVLVTIYLVI